MQVRFPGCQESKEDEDEEEKEREKMPTISRWALLRRRQKNLKKALSKY